MGARTIARITCPRASTGRRIWVCTIGKAFETCWSSAPAQMIVLPPLGAPKHHMITHDCIEITNSKSSTACSRCRRRCCCRGRCRCCRSRSCSCWCERSCCRSSRRRCRCRRRSWRGGSRWCWRRRHRIALNKFGALVYSKVEGAIEQSGNIGIRQRILREGCRWWCPVARPRW